LDREGIEMGRKFLEDAVWGGEVRGGDFPLPKSKNIVGVVLLSGIINVPRVKEILEKGAAFQKELIKRTRAKANMIDMGDYEKQLDPLMESY